MQFPNLHFGWPFVWPLGQESNVKPFLLKFGHYEPQYTEDTKMHDALKTKTWSKLVKWVLRMVSQSLGHFRVLRMGRAESQILAIVIKKLVNWLTKKLYDISRLSCYDQYFLLMHGDQLRPTFRLTLTNFLFWVSIRSCLRWTLRTNLCENDWCWCIINLINPYNLPSAVNATGQFIPLIAEVLFKNIALLMILAVYDLC